MDYLLHILIFMCIYIILSLSYNIILGNAGIFSIAHGAFYGLGAYAVAILTMNFGMNFWAALVIGVILVAVISLALAFPAIRIRGDYLLIVSFAFQLIIVDIFTNWISLFGGPGGLPGIPPVTFFGAGIYSLKFYFLLALAMAMITVFIVLRISGSPLGLILRALKEDEIAVQAMGKDVVRAKILAMCIGCGLAGLAGGVMAVYVTCIDPSMFSIHESIYILTMVILGGMGDWKGAILGAVILVSLPEILRFTQIPADIAGFMHEVIYGCVLIAFMRFRPQGLLSSRKTL